MTPGVEAAARAWHGRYFEGEFPKEGSAEHALTMEAIKAAITAYERAREPSESEIAAAAEQLAKHANGPEIELPLSEFWEDATDALTAARLERLKEMETPNG